MNDNDLNRRNFISASATGAAVLLARPQAARAAAPSDRVRIGIIGAGNRGFNTLTKKLVGLRASWTQSGSGLAHARPLAHEADRLRRACVAYNTEMRRRFQFGLKFLFVATLVAAFVAWVIRASRDGEIASARANLKHLKSLQAECHVIDASPGTMREIDAKVDAAERRLTNLKNR